MSDGPSTSSGPAYHSIIERIRRTGPITVAEFMDLALYHPQHGYYATSARRSGRAGDFFTSVDVGPLFGEMLAVQIDEMARVLADRVERIDLVEAGAGNGRLMRDVLDTASVHYPETYERVRVTLVERSAAARDSQRATLGPHASRLSESSDDLPPHIRGIVVANELLDALPVHIVVQRGIELREIRIAESDGVLHELETPLSTPRLTERLAEVSAALEDGWRVEVGLAAYDWTRRTAESIERGFLLLFDYGHAARDLYSASHSGGTLMAYRGHVADARGWLENPGALDLTSHVDLTAVERAACEGGMICLAVLDQTYFLANLGITERLSSGSDPESLARRLAAKTLLMPGGLGSTMKVVCFGKDVGRPALRGLSSGRLT
jgi:SAM-dependent MidA family methyltransferase